ncbi:hypothetical protein NF867_03950 [Solitalea sp. MAHUQ-68]|uniref:Uncharacterized protein n=1 Tax=Solitalea agri TaxID=2953739 RepID=A0A9X2JC05_9SPHI|nr:hypothetical protein [Solitalea agri]MCO4292014.1 hypothetical protein [Solitalea agri]
MSTIVSATSFTIGIVGFFILVYVRWFKEEKFTKLTAVGAILLIQAFVTFIIASIADSNRQDLALRDLKQFLKQDSLVVKINNESLDSLSTTKILNVIRSIKIIDAHHSHPIDTTYLQIITPRDTVYLTIGKDSERPNEYWVFWTKYFKESEIGRIQFNRDTINGS